MFYSNVTELTENFQERRNVINMLGEDCKYDQLPSPIPRRPLLFEKSGEIQKPSDRNAHNSIKDEPRRDSNRAASKDQPDKILPRDLKEYKLNQQRTGSMNAAKASNHYEGRSYELRRDSNRAASKGTGSMNAAKASNHYEGRFYEPRRDSNRAPNKDQSDEVLPRDLKEYKLNQQRTGSMNAAKASNHYEGRSLKPVSSSRDVAEYRRHSRSKPSQNHSQTNRSSSQKGWKEPTKPTRISLQERIGRHASSLLSNSPWSSEESVVSNDHNHAMSQTLPPVNWWNNKPKVYPRSLGSSSSSSDSLASPSLVIFPKRRNPRIMEQEDISVPLLHRSGRRDYLERRESPFSSLSESSCENPHCGNETGKFPKGSHNVKYCNCPSTDKKQSKKTKS